MQTAARSRQVELRLKEARGQDYATTRLRVPTGESVDPIPMRYFVPVGTYTVTRARGY